MGKAGFYEQELRLQRQWVDEHGGDLAGYVEHYGSKSDPDHYGSGGEAIFKADHDRLIELMETVKRLGGSVRVNERRKVQR